MGDERGLEDKKWFDEYRERFLYGAASDELDGCKATRADRENPVTLSICLMMGTTLLAGGFAYHHVWPGFWSSVAATLISIYLIIYYASARLYSVERCVLLRRNLDARRADPRERERKAERERKEREKSAKREREERERAEREQRERQESERERARTHQSDAGTGDFYWKATEAYRQRLKGQVEMALKILGIPRHPESFSEIETAYRRAIRANHPDKNANDDYAAERFKLIQESYEFLSEFRDAFDSM